MFKLWAKISNKTILIGIYNSRQEMLPDLFELMLDDTEIIIETTNTEKKAA